MNDIILYVVEINNHVNNYKKKKYLFTKQHFFFKFYVFSYAFKNDGDCLMLYAMTLALSLQ